MAKLTEGALNNIMQGNNIENAVLQYMGHKKLSNSERYRLLVNDGLEVNSFAMLSPQLNHYITDNILTENSIIKITKMAISMVNNNGNQRRVMIVLGLEVLIPGSEIGMQIVSENQPPQNPTSAQPQPSVPSYNRPAPQINSSISGGGTMNITPIAALTPYQNKWVIKARVTNKSDKRSWSNARGEGTLFSMELLDESGEIRCTAFKQQCEQYYDMIEVGRVYYISKGILKPADKRYNALKNDYEMTLGNESEIVPCNEESDNIPSIKFDFLPINEIEKKEANTIVDVMGIVKSCSDLQQFTARASGRELKKKDVHIVDQTRSMISLTLWGSQAENFNGDNNPVIAIKSARVGEFQGGKNISALQSSTIQMDPDIPEAHQLRGWYSSVGSKEDVNNLSKTNGGGGFGGNAPWLSFKEAKDLRYGQNDQPNMYTVKATINFIKPDNCLYKSCPTETCKKKVIDQANDMYRCEKCDREFPNFKYRLLAQMSLSDWSGHQWVTAFNDDAEIILGGSSQDLGEMKDTDNNMFMDKICEAGLKSFIFKLRVRLENFSDEWRLKTTVAGVTKLNFKTYNSHLLEKIRELAQIGRA